MVSLAARSALSGIAVPGHYGRADRTGVVIEERTDFGFAGVTCKHGKHFALINAVNTAFGIVLPDGPRRVSRGYVTFAGVGPDQWIASAGGADAVGFAARVRARIGPFAAVSDQSDARLVLRVSGPRVRDVLAKGVPVDLHPKAFKPGDIACTVVGYINTQIDMLDEATYQLAAPRSMAGSFWSWLTAAAAEFGYEVRGS
ncbi:MAG: sarcosine oxidase subunit gamma family protein [Xanthobacteraceae bacterium]